MKTNKSIFECYEKQLHSIVSNVFFEQLEKVAKETKSELSRWYNNYEKAVGAEKIAFNSSITGLQSSYLTFAKAKEVYDKELAKVVNNTICSVPVINGTNNVVKEWNVDTENANVTYQTANDLLSGMIVKIAKLTENSLFTVENLATAGLSLDETSHTTFKDLGVYASSLYAEFKKASKNIAKDTETFKVVCGLIDNSFSISLRFIPESDKQAAKETIISEYIISNNVTLSVAAKIWDFYGFAEKAESLRKEIASAKVVKVDNATKVVKVDYKPEVRKYIEILSTLANRKKFKYSQLKQLYVKAGYPMAK